VDSYHATKRGVSLQEFKRRDAIVRELAAECKVKVGDTCFPIKAADYELYGAFIVSSLATSYMDMGANETWPDKGDNPLILSIRPLKTRGSVMFCTTNWVVAKNPHVMVEC
jgi:hypothetical protein